MIDINNHEVFVESVCVGRLKQGRASCAACIVVRNLCRKFMAHPLYVCSIEFGDVGDGGMYKYLWYVQVEVSSRWQTPISTCVMYCWLRPVIWMIGLWPWGYIYSCHLSVILFLQHVNNMFGIIHCTSKHRVLLWTSYYVCYKQWNLHLYIPVVPEAWCCLIPSQPQSVLDDVECHFHDFCRSNNYGSTFTNISSAVNNITLYQRFYTDGSTVCVLLCAL